MPLTVESKQKGLRIFRRQKYTGDKHFKGKIVASRIDLNTQTSDLFFMLLMRKGEILSSPPLSLALALTRSFPDSRKDGMRITH